METRQTDVLIVGSGLAGLYTALHIDLALSVLFVTKDAVDISSSWLAQGGIAAAISPEDSPQSHFEDTLIAGDHLCDERAVQVLVDEGPRDIRRLVNMRVPFDLDDEGDLAITREGGHTKNRIVHAGGDATGRETVKVLAGMVAQRPNVNFAAGSFLVELLVEDGQVCGAVIVQDGVLYAVSARCVVLATGGCGQIYSRTTNPSIATGDGIAAAARAGAALRNMEFIQFHPTALYDDKTPGRAFLISEAVRGEGALLKNADGERFMPGQHPMAELAPRDIVARANVREMARTGSPCVYLDATVIPPEKLRVHFPTIMGECARRGIDIEKTPIPVCPAQHYLMGGVAVDLYAQTTIPGLFAVGEASCTGVHGANRLASNSMLECLVFGRRCAQKISETPVNIKLKAAPAGYVPSDVLASFDGEKIKTEIREICDRDAGVVRRKAGLTGGLAQMREILRRLEAAPSAEKSWWECRNMAQTACAVLDAALARPESRGGHYRED